MLFASVLIPSFKPAQNHGIFTPTGDSRGWHEDAKHVTKDFL